MSLFKSIINSIEEINYLRTQLKEDNARESERKIQESKLLSPEFDYLKIRENGKLERGYPIPMVMSFTYDKVAATAIIKGYEYMGKMPELGWTAYLIGQNDVYERVGKHFPFLKNRLMKLRQKQTN